MKFLMTSTFYPPYHIGGDAVHVKWLADELAKQGHEVHVMFSLDAYEFKSGKTSKADFKQGAVNMHPLKAGGGKREVYTCYLKGKLSYYSREFDRLLNEISPDVVHHHNISLLGYDILRKRRDYLNLYTAHDYWLVCQTSRLFKKDSFCEEAKSCNLCAIGSNRPPQMWRRQKSFTAAVRDIDMVIAPSDYVRNTLEKMTGLPVTTIRNFVPEPPQDIAPSGFSNYFLYVGVLEEFKGIMELVRIFKDYRQEIDARLLIAGTGTLEKRLRSYINENDIEDVVQLLGWRDHASLYPLYSDAHALVIPSIWPENAPLVALEALSVGTPVITSDQGGLPEIANLQGEGFVCGTEQLKDIIVRIRESVPERQKEADVYRRYFSAEQFIASYMKLITERQAAG